MPFAEPEALLVTGFPVAYCVFLLVSAADVKEIAAEMPVAEGLVEGPSEPSSAS